MVQFANFYAEVPNKSAAAVKLEIEDTLEEQYGPLNKKPKSPCQFYQWGANAGIVPPESAHCSLLEEPSPLGLRLRKSPSLLDLIQMRLSQGNSATVSNGSFETGKKKDLRSNAALGTTDKLKASNFPASVLRIGSWESVSRYEGDLVAKCYYAKHKLVWEVLDGGLKSKIEIQWSDITALKATCPENGPGTLDIVLATQPLFFRETNPQPRKHTLWQATSDFTNGQASMHRRHFLQCPSGLLNKHFEKLIQCDPRLNSLSRQPDIILEYPYFEPRCSVFEDHGETKFHAPMVPGFQDPASPSPCNAPTQNETRVSTGRTRDKVPRSPSSVMFNHISVMDTCGLEENRRAIGNPTHWDEIRALGLQSSMLMCDVVNHIGHCNPILPTDSSLSKSMLEELTRNLNNDSQVVSASDEQSLMSRVDSLGCLLEPKDRDDEMAVETKPLVSDLDMGKEPKMSRKESYGELLMHLPRIASLPQFLFNMADDSGR